MTIALILNELKTLPRKENGEVYVSSLKPLIQRLGVDHGLAIDLWRTGEKMAREVAVRIADPGLVDEALLEGWVSDLDEWGLTDAFTGHLVKYTSCAVEKAYEWARRTPEFERRAGFATIAQMAWAKNDFKNDAFLGFLPIIEEAAIDERFYVKKAVNWALRDIGKRNDVLCNAAQVLALKLQQSDHKTVRWVGTHRCREFLLA